MKAGKTLGIGVLLIHAWIFGTVAQAQFAQVKSFQEIKKVITPETWVFLDLDNTVFETHQTLGSDHWFDRILQKYFEEHQHWPKALERAVQHWTEVQNHAPMRPVEADTPQMIRELQSNGLPVIGLTARNKQLADRTVRQLSEMDVDFNLSTPAHGHLNIDPEAGEIQYQDGIIFVGEIRNKGEALSRFLRLVQAKPKHIVFADDKEYHARSVEKVLQDANIDHFIFHYTATDARNAQYDPRIAEIQWKAFQEERRLLSDEEARALLNTHS